MNAAEAFVLSGCGIIVVSFWIAWHAARRLHCRIYPWGSAAALATIAVLTSIAAGAGNVASLPALPVLAAAGVSAVTDLQTGYVFNDVLLFAASALCVITFALGATATAAAGAIIGGSVLWALHALTKGQGLGLGDVKLGVLLGAAAGAGRVLDLLAIAFISGGAAAVTLLVLGRRRRTESMPFAPFLMIAGCSVAFWENAR